MATLGQKKAAIVERWLLLWGRLGGSYENFFREYNMFFLLSLCLLCPIIMEIQ